MSEIKRPKRYQCPICEEESGAFTRVELHDHLVEIHLEQQTKEDFINEIIDSFTEMMAYIEGLKDRDYP